MRKIIAYIEIAAFPILIIWGYQTVQYSHALGIKDKYSSYVFLGYFIIAMGISIGVSGSLLLSAKRAVLKSQIPILVPPLAIIILLLIFFLLIRLS